MNRRKEFSKIAIPYSAALDEIGDNFLTVRLLFSGPAQMCYGAGVKPERAIFEDKAAAEKAADKRALDDIAAGRVVDHSKVTEWLEKWGTPDEKPLPDSWRG